MFKDAVSVQEVWLGGLKVDSNLTIACLIDLSCYKFMKLKGKGGSELFKLCNSVPKQLAPCSEIILDSQYESCKPQLHLTAL